MNRPDDDLFARLDPGQRLYTPEVQADRRAFVRARLAAAAEVLSDSGASSDIHERLADVVHEALGELRAAEIEILRAHMGWPW